MTLLSPLFLLLAVAAAIPLLIHLLRRRIGTRIEFPAVRYLLRAEQENRRTLRLRNLLLMLLRVATVLLLSTAAARPIGRMIGVGHAPAAIALVVDNTMSTGVVVGGRSMLDRFKTAAAHITSTTMPADHLWLVTADGMVASGTAATVREAIMGLQPTSVGGDLPAAVRRAAGLARAAGQDARVVIVVTDGQRSSWPNGVATGDVRTVFWSPAVTFPDNHAVSLAEARPIRWTPRGEIAARFQSRDSVTYRVTIGGRTLARGTAAPNEEIIVSASPAERGWIGGSVDLAPDELTADDSRYFAAWIGAAPAIIPTAGAGEFVRAALDALRASGRVVRGQLAPSGTRGVPGPGIAVGPADEIPALPALITAPSDPVHLGAANRALERLGIPWRFGVRWRQAVDAIGSGLGSVPVADRYELVPRPGADADTLAAVGRSPWIVAGPRYMLVASPLDASASGLPIRANFIPWLAASITDRLSGDYGTVIAAAPGSTLKRPSGVDQLELPDGSHVVLADSVLVPMNPGVYFFMSGGRRAGAIVVNPPAEESKLDRLSTRELEQMFGGATVVDVADPSSLQASAFRAASTRSLLPPVLIAVLLMLFAEGLVVTARRHETA
jgi:Aerotolerance regulator N-terminal